jgi:hypothetical protein
VEKIELISKAFDYLGCNDPHSFFGFSSDEDLALYQFEDHIKEIWIYHKIESIQGKYIPKMIEFGTMFDVSEEHKYSFQTGPYLVLQDVGDIELDCSNVEHFRLALALLKLNSGVAHREVELRNLRFFDGTVFFFDFNISKESDTEEDHQRDINKLQKCFR